MRAQIVGFDKEFSPDIIRIRTAVFVDEQGIDTKLDFDGLDVVATHVLAFSQGNAIGTGRILNDGHIGRIAVLKDYRNQGVGAATLSVLLTEAKKRNYQRIYLGSQMHAVAFYENFGFKTCGDVFMDAGLEHIEMEILF